MHPLCMWRCSCRQIYRDFQKTALRVRAFTQFLLQPRSASAYCQRVCVTAKKPTQAQHCPLNSTLHEDHTFPYPGPSFIPGCSVASQWHRVSPFATSPPIWDILFYKGESPPSTHLWEWKAFSSPGEQSGPFWGVTFELTTSVCEDIGSMSQTLTKHLQYSRNYNKNLYTRTWCERCAESGLWELAGTFVLY